VRQAPPVGVTCSAGGAWRASGAGLAALSAGVTLVWTLLHLDIPAAVAWLSAAVAALAAGGATWRAAASAPVALRWDGQRWLADDAEGEVDVMIDFGAWMLLRWRGAGTRWFPLPESEAGGAWPALRRALYAAPRAPAAGGEA
jgi:hypothetical protein